MASQTAQIPDAPEPTYLFDITKLKFSEDKEKDQLVEMARTAEAAERYDDMCMFMRERVRKHPSQALSVEERNLLSVAYKNVIVSRRASWRTLNVEENSNQIINQYRSQVEKELKNICDDVLALLNQVLLKSAKQTTSVESVVFYQKMIGDYYRYLAEFMDEGTLSNSDKYSEKARGAYEAALKLASDSLAPTHPIRLGLALNFSVCHYEILKDHVQACKLAKKAFDDAISKLDQLDEASYKDSTLIMQLLRDNLTLWTSDSNQQDAEEENP